ncbi:MAG: peptidylprolyl isomerase [Opitutales bacterium]
MSRWATILSTGCLLATSLSAQSAPESAPLFSWENQVSNGIAAVVEDKIITREELRREMEPLLPGLARRADSPGEFQQMAAELAQEVLQNLVDRVLIVKQFDDEGFVIPSEFLENRYEERINVDFNGDRKAFLDWLRSQGKTPRQYREELKESIIVGVMREDLRRTTSEVSPERIREYHKTNSVKFLEEEAVYVRLILLTPRAGEPLSVLLQEADGILQKLEDGAVFSDVAKTTSDDERADEGGDWGWLTRRDLRPELVDVAFNLDPGSHSEPIPVDGSVFIICVDDYRQEGIKPLEEVRDEIEDAITAQLARRAQQRWLERLREGAYIKYFLDDGNPSQT